MVHDQTNIRPCIHVLRIQTIQSQDSSHNVYEYQLKTSYYWCLGSCHDTPNDHQLFVVASRIADVFLEKKSSVIAEAFICGMIRTLNDTNNKIFNCTTRLIDSSTNSTTPNYTISSHIYEWCIYIYVYQ